MNNYILDTQVLLWWLEGDKKLSNPHKEIIDDAGKNIYISTISLLEVYIKTDIGKLDIPDDLQKVIIKVQFQILPILFPHLDAYLMLPKIHNDPFDRLIIAQAIAENLQLITYDKIIYQYPVKVI